MTKARNLADIGSYDKLATTSTGIDVTGTATMDGLTVDNSGTAITITNGDGLTQLGKFSGDATNGFVIEGKSNNNLTLKTKANTLGEGIKFVDTSDSNLMFIDGTTGDISFYEDTGTTAKFFWDASAESLTLDNATSTYGLDITGQGNGDRGMRVKNETDGTAARSNFRIENAGGTGANILYPATSYTGVSGWANRLVIGTDGASNGLTLRGSEIRLTGDDSLHNPDLVVTSSGNVGVGSASAITKLHVNGGSGPATSIANASIAQGNPGTSGTLATGIDATGAVPFYSWIQSRGTTNDGNYYNLALNPSGGNVGVGTTSPSNKLHVSSPTSTVAMLSATNTSTAWLGLGNNTGVGFVGSNGSGVEIQTAGSSWATKLKVDSAGRVTMPYQPSFHAMRDGDWIIPVMGSYQNVPYTSTLHNIGSHFNTSTSKFTAPVAGSYYLSYNTRLDGHGGSYLRSGFAVNGAVDHDYGFFLTQDTGAYTSLNGSHVIYLNAGDYVTIYARTQSDSTVNVSDNSSFSGYLLG